MKKFLLTCRDIIVILLLVVVAQIIAGIQTPGLMNNHAWTLIKTDFLAPLIYGSLFYLGFYWLKKKVYRNPFKAIQWPPQFKLRYFGYALGLIILIILGWLLVGVQVRTPRLNHYLFWQNMISAIFADALAAPFVEEIAFRGVILGQVARRYSVKAGLFVSALLFGLVHLLNGRLNWTSAIQLVVSGSLMGLLLGLVYLREHSIWADYTVHAVYNLFWDLFPIQQGITHDWPLQFITSTHNQLLTGGQYGTDCSLPNIVAYLLMGLVVLYLLKNKRRG